MWFVYVAINPRQPYYNFYITHLNWPTNHSCSAKILKQQKFSKQTLAQRPTITLSWQVFVSTAISACECASEATVLKGSGGVRERTKVTPKNILLAFVTVEIAITLGNGRPGGTSARSWFNADAGQTSTEWAWTSNKIHAARILVALRIEIYTFKALLSKWRCIVGWLYMYISKAAKI